MTESQFDLLARLLPLAEPTRGAARAVVLERQPCATAVALHGCAIHELEAALDALHRLEMEIRGTFVLHGPDDFRVTVDHHDTHRMPGAQPPLALGQIVRLQAHSTERWIPVRVISVPKSPAGYYEGIIVEQLAPGSRFQAGNRVKFGEDQVMTPDTETRPGIRRRRY